MGRQHFTWLPEDHFLIDDFLRCAEEEDVWIASRGSVIEACLTYFVAENFLHFLLVDRAFRRQGVGSTMLDHIRGWYGAPHSLKVNGPNVSARRFYAGRGYVQIDRGVSDGVDWLLMRSP